MTRPALSYHQMAVEYLLVYCTSHGLTAIGEPPLPKSFQPVGDSTLQPLPGGRQPMPVWMVSIFLLLATAKYMLSFIVWYVFLVISAVVMVASVRIRSIAAARAYGHIDSQRERVEALVRKIRVVGAFKSAKKVRLQREQTQSRARNVSVTEVRHELRRRDTLRASMRPIHRRPLRKLWIRITSMACFRGCSAYLIMTVAQWYLSVVTDFFLSGQPSELRLGYGTTSIVLATVFASGSAVWTHYTITKPSNKKIFDHFPKGGQVLIELWPMTAAWAVSDHICMSGPLALSRSFELKKYAFDPESWNALDEAGQKTKVLQFALVFLLYITLVTCVSVPANMVLRRVHASMLSDGDLAIVPFARGEKDRNSKLDERSHINRPGLTVSQAWSSITWTSYFDVLRVYLQYFAINQFIQMAYWSANWKLHDILEVNNFASTHLPCSPVGEVKPFYANNTPLEHYGGFPAHKEL